MRVHQIRHRSVGFIVAFAAQPKVAANSGEFCSTPFSRILPGQWLSSIAQRIDVSVWISHQSYAGFFWGEWNGGVITFGEHSIFAHVHCRRPWRTAGHWCTTPGRATSSLCRASSRTACTRRTPRAVRRCRRCSRPACSRRRSATFFKWSFSFSVQNSCWVYISYVLRHFLDVKIAVLFHKAAGPVDVLGDGRIRPPLAHVAVLVVHPTCRARECEPFLMEALP